MPGTVLRSFRLLRTAPFNPLGGGYRGYPGIEVLEGSVTVCALDLSFGPWDEHLSPFSALSSTPRTASEFGGITDVSRRVQGPADVTCKRQEEKLSSASRTATRVPSPLEDLRSPGSPQLLRPRGSTVDLPEQPHPSGPGSAPEGAGDACNVCVWQVEETRRKSRAPEPRGRGWGQRSPTGWPGAQERP